MTIYFDNAATTKIKPEVFKEMIPYLSEEYGNPSSLYHIGRNAKKAIEQARENVAKLINCNKNEIIFTSGGSESDNIVIKGIWENYFYSKKKNHIITSKIEHPAIINACKHIEKQGGEITYINVDENGFVKIDEIEKAIKENTALISIMFANNEVGSIQSIKEISMIAHKYAILFHTDAVQAVGNVEIDVKKMGIDMLSMSGHKIYGPKGIGALYIKDGIDIRKLIDGGHQEKDRRAGTENLAGIIGLGKACILAKNEMEQGNNHIKKIMQLRDYYVKEVLSNITDVKINGPVNFEKRLPGNANISFKEVEATALLLELDKKGICVSSGSACSSGEDTPSHVLTAMGTKSDYAFSAIRTSFGYYNEKWEIDYCIKSLKEIVERLRNNI